MIYFREIRLVLICVCLLHIAMAGLCGDGHGPLRGAELSGQVKRGGSGHNDTLQVYYVEDSLQEAGSVRKISVVTDSEGRFRFSLACENLMKMKIWDKSAGCAFISLSSLIVEPGDVVRMIVDLRTGPAIVHNAVLSGYGSAKFDCLQKLENVRMPAVYSATAARKIEVLDSLLRLKERILNSFKTLVSPRIWPILRADALGETGVSFMSGFLPDIWNSVAENSTWWVQTWQAFEQMQERLGAGIHIQVDDAKYASNYVEYLYTESKYSIWHEEGVGCWNDQRLVEGICQNYRGLLRDQMLWLFINDHYRRHWQNEDLGDFRKVLAVLQNPKIKQEVEQLYCVANRGKPYPFELLRDSSNVKVALSDFKGKVVLVDMWAYYCGACIEFSNVFHEKIYPMLKSDTNFVVVSILVAEDSNRIAYIHRLRGEDALGRRISFKSTEADYVNLFSPGEKTKKIRRFYNEDSTPLILLIDKTGRTVTTTQTGFPFFTEANFPNVQVLLDLIRRELSK
jgi:thiol-disulfide isomerase/thioredoxin